MDNLVLDQHTILYIHVARTVPIFLHKHSVFYIYDTHLYLPKGRPYDGGIKLLNLF